MHIPAFALERYFAEHEFSAQYLLSSSDCDGYAMAEVLQFASESEQSLWDELHLGYTESLGHPLLREAIGQYYQVNDPAQIMVASPGELNYMLLQVLLSAGDHVVTMSPCYQSLAEVVRSVGCEVSYWKPASDTWNFEVTDLEALVRQDTKLIIINFPHNPTGSYLSMTALRSVIEIARKGGAYLFSDEMYWKLVLDQELGSLPPVCDVYEKGISLWGTSKTMGLAGLRIGWLVTTDLAVMQGIMTYKDYLSICNAAPSEILAMIALNHLEKFLIPNLEKINRNLEYFADQARNSAQIKSFTSPRAGSTGFVELDIPVSTREFCDRMVAETGVMAVPGEMFGWHGQYIRIGFGRENLPEAIDQFLDYLVDFS